jgi:coiled-coil domain-containing protein 12
LFSAFPIPNYDTRLNIPCDLPLQDLTNIQPKKPNWDLKRDLDKRLAKLEPKTESAIAHLIRKSTQQGSRSVNTDAILLGKRIATERAANQGGDMDQDGTDLANAVEGRDFSKEAADSDEDEEG